MKLGGVEIHYSALANEIIRELNCAGFCGDADGHQTYFQGVCEGILVMYLLAKDDKEAIRQMRKMTRAERCAQINDFLLDHEAEMTALVEEVMQRVAQAMAASTEGDGEGKPVAPALES